MVDKLCACGCGGVIVIKSWYKYTGIPDYINGHNRRGKIPHNKGKKASEETCKKISESLTGRKLSSEHKIAISEGNTGHEVSQESRDKNRDSNTGLKRTPETCENISVAKKKFYSEHPESIEQIRDTVQAFYDDMDDPGQQIVKHHYIYDESDLTKYTTKITRSKHALIHMVMRKEGIVVPHINIKDEI